MRGLLLLFPLLWVLAMLGYAEGEVSSQLDSLQPSYEEQQNKHVLLRNIREARRDKKDKKPERQEKGNGKKKIVRRRKKGGRPNKKQRPSNPSKQKIRRKIKKAKKNKRPNKPKKKGPGRKKKNRNQKVKNNKNKKKKKKNQFKKEKFDMIHSQKPNDGKRQATCSADKVSDTCLENALESMNFEKNQIQNFFKQKARLQNHAKLSGNKMKKNMNFVESAGFMLQAIGGDAKKPTCGEGNSTGRSTKDAIDKFNVLSNCNATIVDDCKIPNGTFDQAKLDDCETRYKKVKTDATACRETKEFETDAAKACDCWKKVFDAITELKKEKCAAAGSSQAKAVKKQKIKCVDGFKKCKKAQDSAVMLIHACMSGEVNTNDTAAAAASTGRLVW